MWGGWVVCVLFFGVDLISMCYGWLLGLCL